MQTQTQTRSIFDDFSNSRKKLLSESWTKETGTELFHTMQTFIFLSLLLLGVEISLIGSFSTTSVSFHKNAFGVNILAHRSRSIAHERSRRASHLFGGDNGDDDFLTDRRDLLQQSSLLAGASLLSNTALAWNAAPGIANADTNIENVEGFQVVKTDSGLKYIDLEMGSDSPKTPQYGQLCVISYTGYLQLPKDDKKSKFGSQSGFVLKHGNGKLIAGLDEGLHTMRKGGRRRLIIPPKLGFVADGLGPVPEMPWQRESLNNLLSQMVQQRGGNLIYDVQLERFFDDEADQGYYTDDEISPEEFAELNRRLNRNNGALDSVGDDIEIAERDREKPIV